jgi:hypothetical protein
MMDLGRISLDDCDFGKWDTFLGRISWLLYRGSHQDMIGAQYCFERFIEFELDKYAVPAMGTRHAM